MAFTFSSSVHTLVWASNVATYNATAHGVGGLLYIKYTKGSEDGLQVAFAYKSKGLDAADRYQHVSLNATTRVMIPTTYIINASGNYRIPITWTTEETAVTFTFTPSGGSASGTVDVDFREAE